MVEIKLKTKKCFSCGKAFKQSCSLDRNSRYCSTQCRNTEAVKRNRARRRKTIELKKFDCPICSTKIETWDGKRVTCGQPECIRQLELNRSKNKDILKYGKWKILSYTCKHCKEKFFREGYEKKKYLKRKYCSAKCCFTFNSKKQRSNGSTKRYYQKYSSKSGYKEKNRNKRKTSRETLSDTWIKKLLYGEYYKLGIKLKAADFTKELIEMKKAELNFHRLTNTLSRTNRPKGCNLAFEE